MPDTISAPMAAKLLSKGLTMKFGTEQELISAIDYVYYRLEIAKQTAGVDSDLWEYWANKLPKLEKQLSYVRSLPFDLTRPIFDPNYLVAIDSYGRWLSDPFPSNYDGLVDHLADHGLTGETNYDSDWQFEWQIAVECY